MGQKVNPISFRSSNNKNPLNNYNWFYPFIKKEYSFLVHQDLFIKEFITNFLTRSKLYVHAVRIIRNFNLLFIDLSFSSFRKKNKLTIKKIKKYLFFLIKKVCNLDSSVILQLKIRNLYKKKRFLKERRHFFRQKFQFKRIKNILNIFDLMFVVFTYKSSNILLQFIINVLKSPKQKHFYQINFLKNLFKNLFVFYQKSLVGLKVCIKGRLNSFRRSKKSVFSYGRTPLQSLNVAVNYNQCSFLTKDGAYGVRVWFFYNLTDETAT